jgi:hypothetical protein
VSLSIPRRDPSLKSHDDHGVVDCIVVLVIPEEMVTCAIENSMNSLQDPEIGDLES